MNLLLCLLIMPYKDNTICTTQDSLYDVKSGVLQYISDVPVVNSNVTIYFDDYGKKKLTKITSVVTSDTTHTEILEIDTLQYVQLPNTSQWIKSYRKKTFSLQYLNFKNLSDSVNTLYGILKSDSSYNGVPGHKYIFANNTMNINGTVIEIYGIPVKIDLRKGDVEIQQAKITEIKLNLEIPAETFYLPKHEQIIDINVLN